MLFVKINGLRGTVDTATKINYKQPPTHGGEVDALVKLAGGEVLLGVSGWAIFGGWW